MRVSARDVHRYDVCPDPPSFSARPCAPHASMQGRTVIASHAIAHAAANGAELDGVLVVVHKILGECLQWSGFFGFLLCHDGIGTVLLEKSRGSVLKMFLRVLRSQRALE